MSQEYRMSDTIQGRIGGAKCACEVALKEFNRIFEEQPAPPAESLHEMAKRLCDTFECCDGCPLDGIHKDCLPGTISKLTDAQQQEQLDIMRKWNAENPPKHAKTYRQDFFEKFPGAQKRLDGYPIGWVCDFYKTRVKPQKFRAAYQYQKSWDAPLGYWEA